MFTRKFVLTASAVVVLALLGAASTQAWSSLARTNHLTFSGAVALPGVMLPAGSYTFEAGPQDTDPHVVRVTTRDGRRTLFMGLTIPVARPSGSRGAVVSLGEAPAGQARPIIVWYPKDSTLGHQFRY
jgi:hypothetical protein